MENSTETPKKKSPLFFIAIGVIAIAALVGIKQVYHSLTHESTDNAQVETFTTPVVSRVAGYIDSIYVSDYSAVTSGQPLVAVDAREFDIAIAQAKADLLAAKADQLSGEAQLGSAQAAVKVAIANKEIQAIRTDKARNDLKRDQALLTDQSITQRQSDDSRSAYDAAVKQLAAAQEQVVLSGTQAASARALIERAKASIATREALLQQAQLKLSYAAISAPASGRVGKCNLNPGQYIQPGQTLFTIVNNTNFWVVANFKETQLNNLKVGDMADLLVDGYPDRKITGKIVSFSEATGAKFSLLPPDNATGNFVKVTQRVPVRIEIENVKEYLDILKAGLSVTVEVKK